MYVRLRSLESCVCAHIAKLHAVLSGSGGWCAVYTRLVICYVSVSYVSLSVHGFLFGLESSSCTFGRARARAVSSFDPVCLVATCSARVRSLCSLDPVKIWLTFRHFPLKWQRHLGGRTGQGARGMASAAGSAKSVTWGVT